ncbi:DUF1489 domain-containing protein [Marivibrio halodurans]|uniref:DUF1489 domain-containing protein n=1 Tax=Marivibrio halodurans TaxID=2039722 RepID=A0A8J7S6D4_9PROT|nr:DUF1489 domain-containing protein [Marivibrio halodurans]MBP5857589.1 DUF1489 domain-containing protein [Marivibrio halodurans]
MVLHLRKLCVGVDRLEDLKAWQKRRLAVPGAHLWHATRNWPRRQQEILDGGGSLYWIIRGQMAARQRVLGFEAAPRENPEDPDEKPLCRILLDADLVPTEPWPHRPFQGWRYLTPGEAPPDIVSHGAEGGLPPDLTAELKARGLW